MEIKFRQIKGISDYVYEGLTEPETIEECELQIYSTELSIKALKDKINSVRSQQSDGDEDLIASRRSLERAMTRRKNERLLLQQWKSDWIEKSSGMSAKNNRPADKDLRVEVQLLRSEAVELRTHIKALSGWLDTFTRIYLEIEFVREAEDHLPYKIEHLLEANSFFRKSANRKPDGRFLKEMSLVINEIQERES